ncbi:MAG TPA: DUF3352 domain-containing protein [Solirubrobacterales bacterium]|nr:DUF3352 domain-containing protein [Solirubrobacterales bacterium]
MKLPKLKRPTVRRTDQSGATEAPPANSMLPEADEPGPPSAVGPRPFEPPRKEPKDDLWFRFSTRVRALGYWLRERAQAGAGLAQRGGRAVGGFWSRRSQADRIKIGAVVGVLLLYAVIKFASIPGVPCSISAAAECAPGDDTVALVPADALLYAHVTLEGDSAQLERAGEAFEQLGELERLVVGSGSGAVPAPSGATVDLRLDVLPWAEGDLAIATVPGPKQASATAFITGVAQRAGAEQFMTKIAPAETPAQQQQGDASLTAYPSGFAYTFIGDEIAFGDELAVRRSLDADSGAAEPLDGSEQAAPLDDLPDARFAEVYLSRDGVQRLLAGRAGPASQLETFVDYAATTGIAAAAVAKDEGIEVDLVSRLDPKLAERSPSLFSALPTFEPSLADEVGSRAIGYAGLGDVGPTLSELLGQPGAKGLGGALQGVGAGLEQEAGVNPLRDLLPALDGQAALVAEPTDAVPFATLIVAGIDEDKVSEALAGLQRPLLRSTGRGGGRRPSFEESEVEGVIVRSIRLSPTVNLSYAVFDETLVLSTDPAGITQVRAGGESLADSGPYEQTTDQLPDQVSALVFLNLDELFGQVTRTGLVEDPSFADLTVLFENASSLGLAVNGEEDSIRTELFLTLD